MEDVRALVPRTPPEGLKEWALQICQQKLERSGLIYEAEWTEGYDAFLSALDELYKPKKIKMVRVKCSCCGGSCLLNWAADQFHGYGFVHPDDEEGDWDHTVASSGDITRCPMCDQKVLVKKRAEVKDHFITAECYVMSAQLVGKENILALTGWTVQRWCFKHGNESLKIIPVEAYVFGVNDCARLMGWRNSYSGNAGYFVSYLRNWSQSRHWKDLWGNEEEIFGLSSELVAASCLPHCKMDKYMRPRVGAKHYPLLYLRLYQEHPNVESLLLHGLPRVLDDLIAKAANREDLALPEIDWTEKRPAQMLHLTKEELRMARGRDWGVLLWDLFVQAKTAGELLADEDIQNAFYLGDEHLSQLVGRGPVAKSIRYLLDQCDMLGVEDEGEDPPPYGVPDVQILIDYWSMAKDLGRDLNDPAVRFPQDLMAAHDLMCELIQARQLDELAQQFRIRRKLLSRYSFAADGLIIRPAASQRDLTREGDALHHCVGTYGKRHAGGQTAIFFIRRRTEPWTPYYTLELDEKTLTVRQNRGDRNCGRTSEVQAFETLWLSWVKAGAPRSKSGKPIVPEPQNKKGRSA